MDASPSQHHPWRVVFYRVSSRERQQNVLAAFVHLDRPGIRVLGTSAARAWYVAVECETVAGEMTARRVVRALDRGAVAVHRAGAGEGLAARVARPVPLHHA